MRDNRAHTPKGGECHAEPTRSLPPACSPPSPRCSQMEAQRMQVDDDSDSGSEYGEDAEMELLQEGG